MLHKVYMPEMTTEETIQFMFSDKRGKSALWRAAFKRQIRTARKDVLVAAVGLTALVILDKSIDQK